MELELGREVVVDFKPWRSGDQRYYVSDTMRARSELHLASPLPWQLGVQMLINWMRKETRKASV